MILDIFFISSFVLQYWTYVLPINVCVTIVDIWSSHQGLCYNTGHLFFPSRFVLQYWTYVLPIKVCVTILDICSSHQGLCYNTGHMFFLARVVIQILNINFSSQRLLSILDIKSYKQRCYKYWTYILPVKSCIINIDTPIYPSKQML